MRLYEYVKFGKEFYESLFWQDQKEKPKKKKIPPQEGPVPKILPLDLFYYKD